MRRLLTVLLVAVVVAGVIALIAPGPQAGPKPCPLIDCGPCAQLTKVRGEKCPVCVAIPGCTP